MMVPIAQEHAGLATVLFACGDDPIYEFLAVLVVYETIGLESKVDVGEGYRLPE